jgi:GTPase SAR1 family protein
MTESEVDTHKRKFIALDINKPCQSLEPVVDLDYQCLFKIVVTGQSNSGKSRILERYTRDTFSENEPCTIGVEFTSKYCTLRNGAVVKL